MKTEMESLIINSECLAALREMPDNCIDLVVTDPPYGYSFMGKNWDKAVPSVEIWKETLRVMKPGAFAFVMSAPRQDVLSQMIVRMTEAGFDMSYSSIYWTYSSGFPKAHNIGKAVDKMKGAERIKTNILRDKRFASTNANGYRNPLIYGDKGDSSATPEHGFVTLPSTPEAKALEGSYGGFQPKPAVEVILIGMKPMTEKTFASQALSNRKGVTWMDDCRIPFEDTPNAATNPKYRLENDYKLPERGKPNDGGVVKFTSSNNKTNPQGRFPANLLVSDDVLGTDYSRYFNLDACVDTFPFLICPKASKKEKNAGCDGLDTKEHISLGANQHKCKKCGKHRMAPPVSQCKCEEPEWYFPKQQNNHPTVKPLKLMSYLITLGSREGDVVLDPFAGSGTTLVAAKKLNRRYIGMELSEEYCKIVEARLCGA